MWAWVYHLDPHPTKFRWGPGSKPVNSFESEQLGRPRECAVWQVGRTTLLNEAAKTVPSLLRFGGER